MTRLAVLASLVPVVAVLVITTPIDGPSLARFALTVVCGLAVTVVLATLDEWPIRRKQ